MSRSTVAKSRQDKTSKTASAPTPAVTHEIVPGKFNDQDWNSMLDHDDGDDFIFDIVEDVCSMAMDTIFKNYIQNQLVPYTVLQAKDAILQIIEWQFLSRDDGEGDVENDPGWSQDEEPAPAVTDCWAQGSVPRSVTLPQTPEPILEEEEEALEEIKEAEEEEEDMEEEVEPAALLLSEPTVIVEENTSLAIEETIAEEEPQPKDQHVAAETHLEKVKKKKGRGYKPHSGPLKSAGLGRMTESLEEREMRLHMEEYTKSMEMELAGSPDLAMLQMPSSCHSILKLQAGRPPGNREVIYDEQGNVSSVVKINPEKLPSHRVKVNFRVVDPEIEAAQATLDAMRTGKYIAPGSKQASLRKQLMPKPPELPRPSSGNSRSTARNSRKGSQMLSFGHTRDGITPLPPPLIESMEVTAGVVVREGDRVKKGPRQKVRHADLIAAAGRKGLKAITITGGADPKITVSEILQHQEPVVRPLTETPPIPPIQQRSPVC